MVKAPKIYQKNPAQHMADLYMLEVQSQLAPAFFNADSETPKSVECIRVASGEGPLHEEVQY